MWCNGDFDDDGDIDISNYNELASNFSPTGYAGPAPAGYVAPTCSGPEMPSGDPPGEGLFAPLSRISW